MIKTKPVLKDYIWGGEKLKALYGRVSSARIAESWELSVHSAGESIIGGGAYDKKPLSEYIRENPGCIGGGYDELPILIKYIDARDNLSVQVHPSDEYARTHENDNGKTEMWYIVKADAGAGIYCGLNRNLTKGEFADLIEKNRIEECLNFIEVKAGDCFLIEAGTLHAIGKGTLICEVQQNSNVTYRVYDYGRAGADGKPRELHVDKALQVTNLTKFKDNTNSSCYEDVESGKLRLLTRCKYFACRELLLEGDYFYKNPDSYAAFNIIEGGGTVQGIEFKAGDTFFLPRGESATLSGKAKIIITALD